MAVFFYLSNGACENQAVFHGQKFGGTGLGQGKEWGCAQVRVSQGNQIQDLERGLGLCF